MQCSFVDKPKKPEKKITSRKRKNDRPTGTVPKQNGDRKIQGCYKVMPTLPALPKLQESTNSKTVNNGAFKKEFIHLLREVPSNLEEYGKRPLGELVGTMFSLGFIRNVTFAANIGDLLESDLLSDNAILQNLRKKAKSNVEKKDELKLAANTLGVPLDDVQKMSVAELTDYIKGMEPVRKSDRKRARTDYGGMDVSCRKCG